MRPSARLVQRHAAADGWPVNALPFGDLAQMLRRPARVGPRGSGAALGEAARNGGDTREERHPLLYADWEERLAAARRRREAALAQGREAPAPVEVPRQPPSAVARDPEEPDEAPIARMLLVEGPLAIAMGLVLSVLAALQFDMVEIEDLPFAERLGDVLVSDGPASADDASAPAVVRTPPVAPSPPTPPQAPAPPPVAAAPVEPTGPVTRAPSVAPASPRVAAVKPAPEAPALRPGAMAEPRPTAPVAPPRDAAAEPAVAAAEPEASDPAEPTATGSDAVEARGATPVGEPGDAPASAVPGRAIAPGGPAFDVAVAAPTRPAATVVPTVAAAGDAVLEPAALPSPPGRTAIDAAAVTAPSGVAVPARPVLAAPAPTTPPAPSTGTDAVLATAPQALPAADRPDAPPVCPDCGFFGSAADAPRLTLAGPDPARSEAVAARLAGLGFDDVALEGAAVASSRGQVRYFRPEDAAAAESLARALDGAAVDLTWYRPLPAEPTIEIVLPAER